MPRDQYKTLCLYYFPIGAPSRHVMLTAKVLGIDLNLIFVDLASGEHLKDEYLQLNPEHKVPTLVDNGFVLSESRAIMIYLTEKYGKKPSLYPKDTKKRAKINQFLYFDADKLFNSLIAYFAPLFQGSTDFDSSKLPAVEAAFKYLNTVLQENDYLVEDKMTLADLAVVSTVATAVIATDFELNTYPNVEKWYNNLRNTLPGFNEIIESNAKKSKEMFEMLKNKNKL